MFDKGQRFVLTTLDSQQSIDPEIRITHRSAYYQIIGCSCTTVQLIFFDFILFISWFLQFPGAEIHFKNVLLHEKVSYTRDNFRSPSIQLPVY